MGGQGGLYPDIISNRHTCHLCYALCLGLSVLWYWYWSVHLCAWRAPAHWRGAVSSNGRERTPMVVVLEASSWYSSTTAP